MSDKKSCGAKTKKKIVTSLKDCFKQPELDGGEEYRKLWNFYREESDDEAIIRRAKRDAYEHQAKYLMCAQGVLYALCHNLGIGSNDAYKAATYVCGGMGGTNICGALVGARMAMGIAYGRANMYQQGWPREVGPSHVWDTLPLANDELSSRFQEYFGAVNCHEIQEKYFGKHFFIASDYGDPDQLKRHENGELYRVISTYAAAICEWTAGVAAEIILREWRSLGIPLNMPLR